MAHLHLVDNGGSTLTYDSDLVLFVVATDNGVDASAIIEGANTLKVFKACITLEQLLKDIISKTAGGDLYESFKEAHNAAAKKDEERYAAKSEKRPLLPFPI